MTKVRNKDIPVELPASEAAVRLRPSDRQSVIGIDRQGAFYWNGQPCTTNFLLEQLRDLCVTAPGRRIRIDMDRDAPFGRFAEVMDACQPKVNEGVELRFVTNLPDHYAVCTNRDCLKKVLELLLDNAARHTREGHITLLVMDSPDRKGCLLLSLTDTGEGIPEERQLTAFDLQPSGDREENLTGAGLYTCKLIIRLLGGIIYVDPHYEKGTRVIFEIKV
jgi:signal transduction histidine kinase